MSPKDHQKFHITNIREMNIQKKKRINTIKRIRETQGLNGDLKTCFTESNKAA
jgi:hypothetical protein